MNENKGFDWKVLAFRVWTGFYTGFLAGFSTAYMSSQDLQKALVAGVSGGVMGILAGFGVDQVMYHNWKKTNDSGV